MSAPAPVALRVTAPVRGALWMVGAAAAFSLMGWSVRALAPIPASEIVLLRSLFGLVLVVPCLGVPLGSLLRLRWPRLYLLRAGLSYLAMLAWFYALHKVALADAVALQFTLPLFTILFAVVVFDERVGLRRWSATLAGFTGALVIIRPGFAEVSLPMVLVLVSAALYAASNMVIKKLAQTEPSQLVVFYLHALTLPLALLGALPYWIWPGWGDLPWIAMLAVSGSLAHYCFTQSIRAADASIVMPFDYLRLPMMAAIGYLAYGEAPVVWTWVGAAVICGATLYIVRHEARLARAGPVTADAAAAASLEEGHAKARDP
ncbi:MAG TPA: DMT family transporter [Alphaproteobacteria bacterium]